MASSLGSLVGGVLLLGVGLLVGSSLLDGLDLSLVSNSSVRIELVHSSLVGKRVDLLAVVDVLLGGSDDGLDLHGVDDTSNITAGHDALRHGVVLLGALATVEGIEVLESLLGPDEEATDVTTRAEGEDVELVDLAEADTGDVAEGLDDVVLVLVDDHGSETADVLTAASLTGTTADLSGADDSLDILVGTDLLEESDSVLGLDDGVDVVVDDKRDFVDLLDSVTAGHDEGGDGGGGEAGDESVSALVQVDVSVPSSPDLGRSEHTALTTHVGEGTLAGAVGTTSRDTRDTSDGSAGTPGLSGVLHTSTGEDGVGLSVVLGDIGVDEVDNIGTNGGGENFGKSDLLDVLVSDGIDGNDGSSSLGSREKGAGRTIMNE